jgi:chemotaxis protein histidine kinase CheA
MGVGAYQAREYVTSVGGTVSVASERGRGTTFAMTLPIAPATADRNEAQSATVQGALR